VNELFGHFQPPIRDQNVTARRVARGHNVANITSFEAAVVLAEASVLIIPLTILRLSYSAGKGNINSRET